uniref:Uncharacterized protein n=1 Tax=Ignavibacterium album TaxID=591197 RepID=A0A7V2ZIS3_9BACT
MKIYLTNANKFFMETNYYYLIIIFVSIQSLVMAQPVAVNLQAPPPYQMRIEDMWNLILINQGEPVDVYLHGIAIEQSSGLIVDVTTSVFNLPRGSKRIRSADVGTVTVNQSNQNYNSVINRLSAVPNGNYEICIEVIRARDGVILGNGCIQHEVLNLSQVTLLYPEDNSSLNIYNEEEIDDTLSINQRGIEKKDIRRGMVISKPGLTKSRLANSQMVFSWLPPTPVPQNTLVTYRIKVVEMYEHQSPYDAMQSNPMFFITHGIFTTSFVYPIASRPFNPNRNYAWQVDAYVGDALLASSEIFSFNFKSSSLRSINDAKRSMLNIIRASNDLNKELPSGLRNYQTEPYKLASANSVVFKKTIFDLIDKPDYSKQYYSQKDERKAVQLGISGELFWETANRKGFGSERKPGYGYTQLTPSVNLYGIPLGLNILLSTENSSERQNINSVSFMYNSDAAKEIIQNQIEEEGEESVPGLMKFFSYFNSFGIGLNYPTYTQLTMQGAPVSGLSFEFNPGWFYLATALQQNQRPIDNTAFRRDLYAGRIGVGKKDDSHIFFTGIYSNDKAASIKIDSLNHILTPNTNYVFGIDSRLNLFEDKLSLEGEISGAMLTRDNRDPDLINEDIPQFVRNIFQPKISSQVDYAYSLKSSFDNSESNTKVTAGVKMIGPGYRSHGNPSLRNDRFEVEGKVDQKFHQRQISVVASMKYYRDNLINSKLFTTTTLAPGVQLGLRFKNYPSLNLTYNPSFLSNDASDPLKKIDFKNHLFTATTNYNFKFDAFTLGSNLFYMFNKSKSLDTLSGYTINSFNISENILFKSPLVITVGFGMNFMNFFDQQNQITNIDGSVGYTFFEHWNSTLGINHSIDKDNSNKTGFYFNSTYSLSENVILDLRLEKNNYKDLLLSSNDFDEIIGRTTIRVQF